MTRWSPPAGSKHPTGLVKVLFPHVQVPEMSNKCLFPFQHRLSFPPISHTSFTHWPPRGRRTAVHTHGNQCYTEAVLLQRAAQWGGGRRAMLSGCCGSSQRTQTDRTGLHRGRRPSREASAEHSAWGAWPVQTPPASHVHCSHCHRAREDTDGLCPQPWFAASHSTMAHACSWGRPWHRNLSSSTGKRHSRPLREQVPSSADRPAGHEQGRR